LERACKLREEDGGGSLTALPIVETQQGNMSAYIPTNVISITDGQILLDSELFNRGYQPAVDTNRSVSRVGGAAQPDAMRKVVRNLRLELAQFEEVERFARFGTEVDPSTRQQIRRGERLRAMLSQPPHDPVSLSSQIVALLAGLEGYLDDIDVGAVLRFLTDLRVHMRDAHPGLMQQIDRTGDLDDETRRILVGSIADYQARWLDEDRERQGIKGDG
jgi:F-type H+-transporting ATPase subunit alpha